MIRIAPYMGAATRPRNPLTPTPHPSKTNAMEFPNITPEIFSVTLFGMTFALRWYALAYIVGLLAGWQLVRSALHRPALFGGSAPLTKEQLDDLLTWIVIGIILGGRLGYVLFYQPGYFAAHPLDALRVWDGGMAFHGGFLGVVIATWACCRRYGAPLGSVANLMALAAPIGLFLGRLANFINAELYGRVTDLPWAVIFPTLCQDPSRQPCTDPGTWFYYGSELPRHPSQLYEAGLEGLLLGALLIWLAFARGWLRRPWSLVGVFLTGYGLARFVVEFARQPDAQFISPGNPLGLAFHVDGFGVTMGQTLSLPMIAIGLWLLLRK